MPLAYFISKSAKLVIRSAFFGKSAVLQYLKRKPIDEVRIIDNTVQMHMIFIGMYCEVIKDLVVAKFSPLRP